MRMLDFIAEVHDVSNNFVNHRKSLQCSIRYQFIKHLITTSLREKKTNLPPSWSFRLKIGAWVVCYTYLVAAKRTKRFSCLYQASVLYRGVSNSSSVGELRNNGTMCVMTHLSFITLLESRKWTGGKTVILKFHSLVVYLQYYTITPRIESTNAKVLPRFP